MVSCICGRKKKETDISHYEGFRGPIPSDGRGDDCSPDLQNLPKVFVSRLIDPEAIRQLKLSFAVNMWDSEDVIPRQKLIHDVQGAAIIFATISDIIDSEILEAAGPQLKLVCNMAADMSNVDVPACERRSIKLHCTGDACTDANAELTCALLLMISRKLLEGHEAVLSESWDLPLFSTGLANGVLGFLGFGRVGWAVASRLQYFGLSRIIYYDKDTHPLAEDVKAEKVNVDEVFTLSDFIVVTLALNADTRGIVDAEVTGWHD
ncbi:hypothetical protein Btru_032983 [Bulinus truncatus]|nr:hypothetical protein Btru_032983 [Bulinus truncatus]